jgi:2,3-bisphosphoglycerate-independent phosphoglycerate mutase
LVNVFGEYIAKMGMHQLRIAETEKYAHVTFFFNGGREEPFEFEDRLLIASPQIATYDEQPEMSALEVTDKLIEAIEGDRYDVIICNFANTDMVGHSGNFEATVKAVETIDSCLGRLIEVIRKKDGEMLITADHGNAEQMRGEDTGQSHTAHTSNRVPFVYVGKRDITFNEAGVLADVAPTMLDLLGLDKPNEMNGHNLIRSPDGEEQ